MNRFRPIGLSTILMRGAVAGAVAALAMIPAMRLDMALTGRRNSDLRLLDGLVPGKRRLPIFGALMHVANGAALGALFSWAHHGLPGPTWVRGVLFAQVENVLLWPIVLLLDAINPAIRSGEVDRFNHPVSFVQEVFRHGVYGATLGAVLEALTHRR